MIDSLLSLQNLTIVAIGSPLIFTALLWIFYRSVLKEKNLSEVFFDALSWMAGIFVLIGAFYPKYFDILTDRTPFLIIVSLSAVLHATSSLAATISEVRSRSRNQKL